MLFNTISSVSGTGFSLLESPLYASGFHLPLAPTQRPADESRYILTLRGHAPGVGSSDMRARAARVVGLPPRRPSRLLDRYSDEALRLRAHRPPILPALPLAMQLDQLEKDLSQSTTDAQRLRAMTRYDGVAKAFVRWTMQKVRSLEALPRERQETLLIKVREEFMVFRARIMALMKARFQNPSVQTVNNIAYSAIAQTLNLVQAPKMETLKTGYPHKLEAHFQMTERHIETAPQIRYDMDHFRYEIARGFLSWLIEKSLEVHVGDSLVLTLPLDKPQALSGSNYSQPYETLPWPIIQKTSSPDNTRVVPEIAALSQILGWPLELMAIDEGAKRTYILAIQRMRSILNPEHSSVDEIEEGILFKPAAIQ